MSRHNTSFLILCFLILAVSGMAAPKDRRELTWIFLNTGSNKTPLHKAESDKMLHDHLGNFTRLHEQGKLLMAGPLGDKGFIQGIVVLNTKSPKEVKKCFLNDPFVQNSYLALEYYPWLIDSKKLHEASQPFKMKEYTLGIVRKGPHWKQHQFKARVNKIEGFEPSLKEFSKVGELGVAGPFENSEKILGVVLLKSSDQKKLLITIQKEPAIRSGEIICEMHSQWLAEGVLEVQESDNKQSSEPSESEELK